MKPCRSWGEEFLIADKELLGSRDIWDLGGFRYFMAIRCLVCFSLSHPAPSNPFRTVRGWLGREGKFFFSSGESIPPFSELRDPNLSWG